MPLSGCKRTLRSQGSQGHHSRIMQDVRGKSWGRRRSEDSGNAGAAYIRAWIEDVRDVRDVEQHVTDVEEHVRDVEDVEDVEDVRDVT